MAGPSSIENGQKGGRPPGRKNNETLRREEVLKAMQQRIMSAADLLLDAQFTLALGQTYLFKIEKYWEKVMDKEGKERKVLRHRPPERVTSEREMREYIMQQIQETELGVAGDTETPDATYYFLTAKDPDGRSIDSLHSRTYGRSVQPVTLLDEDGKSIFDHESKTKSQKALGAFLGTPGPQKTVGHPRARRKQRN